MIGTGEIRTLLRGADMILQSAQEDGLPNVRLVSVHDKVEIQLDAPEHVQAWADWRGLALVRRPLTQSPGRELIECRGSMYDVPFQAYTSAAIERPAVTCARCSRSAGDGACACVGSSAETARAAR